VNPAETWAQIEAALSCDPAEGLNSAQEACGRYAAERGRLALIVRHADGTSERWTYRELDRAAAKAGRMFAQAGLRRGDRVAGLLSRQVESWIVALAAWRGGLVYVPLFCGFGTDALAYRLRESNARLVVVGHQWRDTLEAVLPALADELRVFTVTGPRGTGLVRGDQSFWAEWDRSAADGPVAATAAGDPATLLFTSGTSGDPKSCVMPHSALLAVLPFARFSLGVSSRDLLFTAADPGWAYGLYSTGAAPMAMGVPRVLYSGGFDPAAWLRVLREEGVSSIAAAPSAYRKLLTAMRRKGSPGELTSAAAAGEPLAADVAASWGELGAPPIRDGYGLSEIGMVLADLATGARPQPGTLGGPVPGFAVRLVGHDGEPVAEGESGLIAVERPKYRLSSGYENRPEAWEAKWRGDLFVTDDRARVLPSGRWQFLGREDDMIITSGYNVSPVEVERVLCEHPGIAEAAVVAAPAPRGGTTVRAVVVGAEPAGPAEPAASAEELEAELRSAVTRRVGAHAAPRLFDYMDALPRNSVGKLLRSALRSQTEDPDAQP
jgi:acetyl-CoA synthetase